MLNIRIIPQPSSDDLQYFSGITYNLYKNVRIVGNDADGVDLDFIFIIEDLPAPIIASNTTKLIYLTAEAAWDFDDVSQFYHKKFLEQFHYIYSPHPFYFMNQEAAAPFLPWMIGGDHSDYKHNRDLSYQKLIDCKQLDLTKANRVSAFVSNQTWKIGHRQRTNFLFQLKEYFGESLSLYGQAVGKPVPNKWQAIAPYKYHICIENQITQHIFTEKLLDPLLGWTLPIYCGAPNIDQYFPEESTKKISIHDLSGSIQVISQCLNTSAYEDSITSLAIARDKVISKYSLYTRICDEAIRLSSLISNSIPSHTPSLVQPRACFAPNQTLSSKLKRSARALLTRIFT